MIVKTSVDNPFVTKLTISTVLSEVRSQFAITRRFLLAEVLRTRSLILARYSVTFHVAIRQNTLTALVISFTR